MTHHSKDKKLIFSSVLYFLGGVLILSGALLGVYFFSVYSRGFGAFYDLFLRQYHISFLFFIISTGVLYGVLFIFAALLLLKNNLKYSALVLGLSQYLVMMLAALFAALIALSIIIFSTYQSLPLFANYGVWILAGMILCSLTIVLGLSLIPLFCFLLIKNRYKEKAEDQSFLIWKKTGLLGSVAFFLTIQSLRGIISFQLPLPFFGSFIQHIPKILYLLLVLGVSSGAMFLVFKRNFSGWYLVFFVHIVQGAAVLFTVYGSTGRLADMILAAYDIIIPGFSVYALNVILPDNVVFIASLFFFLVNCVALIFCFDLFRNEKAVVYRSYSKI